MGNGENKYKEDEGEVSMIKTFKEVWKYIELVDGKRNVLFCFFSGLAITMMG